MTSKLAFVLVMCALAALAHAKEELYSDKYDYIDVHGILQNDRLRNQYYACVMDIGPCLTPDSKFFKEKLPEALITKCRKCTAKQQSMFGAIVTYYTEVEPEKWKALLVQAIEKSQKKKS